MKNHLTAIVFLFLTNIVFAQNLKPSQFVHLRGSSTIEEKSSWLIYTVPQDSALVITTASLWCSNPKTNAVLNNNALPVIESFNSSTGIVFRSESAITIGNTSKVEGVYGYNIIGYLLKDE